MIYRGPFGSSVIIPNVSMRQPSTSEDRSAQKILFRVFSFPSLLALFSQKAGYLNLGVLEAL